MSNGPESSRGRWWEIQGEGQPDGSGHRELMTDSRGRSRPERSLSAGADLAEESRHPARAFLWPAASVVVAAGLILSVVYGVSRNKPPSPASATAAAPATRSAAPQDDAGVKQDAGVKSAVPPARQDGLPADGGGVLAPIGPQAGTPRGPAAAGGPFGAPAAPMGAPPPPVAVPPSVSPGTAAGDAGNQPAVTATPTTPPPPQAPQITLEGPSPAAPRTRRIGPETPRTSTDSCTRSGDEFYACTITQLAPVYLPETKQSRSTVRPGTALFLCQSDGSKYSVGKRANHWWAWLSLPIRGVVLWVPVVFLTGAPDNGPEPGLPLCDNSGTTSTDKASTDATTPSATSTRSASTTTTKSDN